MDNSQIDIEELEGAQKLFEAYCEGVGGIAFNGEAIQGWHQIGDRARLGWISAYRKAQELERMRYPHNQAAAAYEQYP